MASNPIVTITMEDGSVMKAELYPQIAPNTVNNFISLINRHFYDGVIFHRVIRGFMLQGGDPDGTGMGGPGYSIKGEFTNNGFP
ncbi:MAG: peptidylprolyl isomerase, partial [Lachnospiraceae bacterium]|nr:peptidylprolyl isomerase [Lachnospiraceae bacterium]